MSYCFKIAILDEVMHKNTYIPRISDPGQPPNLELLATPLSSTAS